MILAQPKQHGQKIGGPQEAALTATYTEQVNLFLLHKSGTDQSFVCSTTVVWNDVSPHPDVASIVQFQELSICFSVKVLLKQQQLGVANPRLAWSQAQAV